jgi:hypothetical protein
MDEQAEQVDGGVFWRADLWRNGAGAQGAQDAHQKLLLFPLCSICFERGVFLIVKVTIQNACSVGVMIKEMKGDSQ